MKKTYIAPEVEVMNIETVEMIASSMGMHEDEFDTTQGQLAGGRRGRWGNLWESED